MPTVRNSRSTHPARSPQVEQMLKSRGIDFEFEANFAISEVREAEEAQVRLVAHRAPKDQVTKYATAMKHGAIFPAIVINESFEKIDGNTRLEAKRKSGADTIAAYVVYGVTPLEARSLSVELNQSNGLAMTEEEIRNFITGAISEGQHPEIRALARMTGVRELKINRWIAETAVRGAFREGWDRGAARQCAAAEHEGRAAGDSAELRLRRADEPGGRGEDADRARSRSSSPRSTTHSRSRTRCRSSRVERESLADEIRAVASGFSPDRASRGSAQHIGGLLRFEVDDLLDVAPEKQPETFARLKELRDRLDAVVARAERRVGRDRAGRAL